MLYSRRFNVLKLFQSLVERKKERFASSVSLLEKRERERERKIGFPPVAESEKRGEVGDADVEGGRGKYLLLSVTRDVGGTKKCRKFRRIEAAVCAARKLCG